MWRAVVMRRSSDTLLSFFNSSYSFPLDQCPASIPLIADARFVAPIIPVDYGTGALNFCSDDLGMFCRGAVFDEFPEPELAIRSSSIAAILNRVLARHSIFRCASEPAGARVQDLSGDVLERYAGKYPFQVNWKDRRPIGAIFLASSGINVATNPRRWILNEGNIDITSHPQGKAAFRDRAAQNG